MIISTGYTLLGGIKAVIWTDAIQMAVVWGGLFAIVFLALQNLDIGFWDTIQVHGGWKTDGTGLFTQPGGRKRFFVIPAGRRYSLECSIIWLTSHK